MTTADDNFAKKISTYLDGGAADIKAGTAYRLQLARQEALARLADPERVAGMQLVGAHAGGGSGSSPGAGSGPVRGCGWASR